jgi:effector-binding domain-containing protein
MRSKALAALLFACVSCRSASNRPNDAAAADLGVEACEVPAFRFLYVESDEPSDAVDAAFDRVEDYVARRDIRPCGAYCGIYFGASDPAASAERARVEVGVAVDGDVTPDPPFRVRDVRPGLAAVAHVRGAAPSPAEREAVRRWAIEHGYRVVGPVHEMFGDAQPLDDAEPETRVLVPIAR